MNDADAASPQDQAALPPHRRRRDAESTRKLLLESARRRFARDGYSATPVRDIAADAGVNVSLINRYFTSKEGLFEACVTRAGEELGHRDAQEATPEDLISAMVAEIVDAPDGEHSLQMLLLLRSSGDAKADAIRTRALKQFAEHIAMAASRHDDADPDELLLRAQLILSAVLGIVLVRSAKLLTPLATATEERLSEPLHEILTALLAPSGRTRRSPHA